MKKLTMFIMLIITTIMLIGCTPKEPKEPMAEYISLAHTGVFAGQNDEFLVTFTTGVIEDNFVLDGKVATVNKYASIMIIPKKYELFNKSYSCTLTVNDESYEAELTKGMGRNNYGANITLNDNQLSTVTIQLKYGTDTIVDIELENKLKDMIDYKKALEIARCELAEDITKETVDDVFPREILIKFVNDSKNSDNPFYWYVALAKSDYDYWCLLIDATSGEVLTKSIVGDNQENN